MIPIGTTEFYFSTPKLEAEKLKNYSEEVFEKWAKQIDETLFIPDFAISLQIEEGSIKGKGKIAAYATVLYFGIAQYGSFFSGLQTIKSQASFVGDFLIQAAENQLAEPTGKKRTKRSSDAIGSLEYLFKKVQNGEISVKEATLKAEAILSKYDDIPSRLLEEIEKGFTAAPLFHQQIPLIKIEDPIEIKELVSIKEIPRNKIPLEAPNPPIEHLRIEIWRDSRKDPKTIRMLKL